MTHTTSHCTMNIISMVKPYQTYIPQNYSTPGMISITDATSVFLLPFLLTVFLKLWDWIKNKKTLKILKLGDK